MSRKSSEEIAASRWRAGSKPPKPPANLDRTSRRLWKEIAEGQPPDWWNPATLRLLRRYCRTAVYCERVADALDVAELGSTEAVRLSKQVIAMNSSLGILAQKMRLSTQVTMSARSTGKMAERGVPDSPLIGGFAVHGGGSRPRGEH